MMYAAATPQPEKALRMKPAEDRKTWFSRNIERNMDCLYGVALRKTGSGADAEDLVAESVLAAWKGLDSLADRDNFRPWLFRIMHNTFVSGWRRKRVRPAEVPMTWSECDDDTELTSFLMEQPDDFLDWWANPEQEVLNRMLGEHIRQAIDSLPQVFRAAVLLVNVDGLSYDEAAEALGVPPGTIRSRMKRGRTLLQKALWEIAVENGIRSAQTGEE